MGYKYGTVLNKISQNSGVINSVGDVQEYRKRLTSYVKELAERSNTIHPESMDKLAEIRGISVDVLKSKGIFYIGDSSEMLLPDYLDSVKDFGVIAVNNRPIYTNRWVIPIYDRDGLVMSMVGYKLGDTSKYMYATPKYFVRGDAVYNSERINKCIQDGYAVVVEGIMDAIRVEELGEENVIATCGADKSLYRTKVMRDVGRIIFIHDNDAAGFKARKHWDAPTYFRIILPKQVKDIDEMARYSKAMYDFTKGVVESAVEDIKNVVYGTQKNIDLLFGSI